MHYRIGRIKTLYPTYGSSDTVLLADTLYHSGGKFKQRAWFEMPAPASATSGTPSVSLRHSSGKNANILLLDGHVASAARGELSQSYHITGGRDKEGNPLSF